MLIEGAYSEQTVFGWSTARKAVFPAFLMDNAQTALDYRVPESLIWMNKY